jgi:hypothetical protein
MLGAAVLALVLSTSAVSYAQRDRDRGERNRNERRGDYRPSDRGRDSSYRRDRYERGRNVPPPQTRSTPERMRVWRDRQHDTWARYRARDYNREHRTWRQRGGYSGYYIPDYRFRRIFGPARRFRLWDLPFIYRAGYPAFQLDGYWVEMLDPYPDYWGDYWYENDDLYIDYVDDGYYLFNHRYPRRPGIAVRININL